MTRPVDFQPITALKPADHRRPMRLPDDDREWSRWMAEQLAPTLPPSLAQDVLYVPSLDPMPRRWAWREIVVLAALGIASLLSLIGFVVLAIYALHIFGLIVRGFQP